MLARYRALHVERPNDWGREIEGLAHGQEYVRWLGAELFMAFAGQDDAWPDAVRRCLVDPLPTGLIVASVGPSGISLRTGLVPYMLPNGTVEIGVLLDSQLDSATTVEVDGMPVRLMARGAELITRIRSGEQPVSIGQEAVFASVRAEPARLRLLASTPGRWSVTDDHGGAWFPSGSLRKWDVHGRPMFHGNDLELDVPAVPLTITCTRGIEFDTVETIVTPEARGTTDVELEPPRRYDPVAEGWYGGDLHVHMNYSGDIVCGPQDAARMQMGEGLHLMNLVAANISHTLVYDREAFEQTATQDLPWTSKDRVARFGVEYRNDLFGHVHALGPTRPPSRYHTGHPGSDQPFDWPPNANACAEFHGMGAAVGYAHPVFSPLSDGSAAEAFTAPRSMDARELVADAALGLVDSMDLLGPSDVEGTAILYHHLLNCGLRLAATAGTDVWLSYSRGPLISNPPGWARVYADLRGTPLSVAAFQDAIRAGRTLATNGPWLELSVDGRRLGDTIRAEADQTVAASVRVTGVGVESVELIGPDGVVSRVDVAGAHDRTLRASVRADRSLWLCAVARGPRHPSVLGPVVFAHTSPVYVDVDGQPVRRAASACWLLDWLDRLDDLIRTHGQFADDAQRRDVSVVVERARAFYRSQVTGASRGTFAGS